MGKRDWSWTILGVFALLLRFLAVQFPEATDEIYSRTFFPGIRNVIDMTLGKLPFPSVYLFILAVFLILGRFFLQWNKKSGAKSKLVFSVRSLLNWAGALVFFFLMLWGYNYQRTSIIKQLGLKPQSLELEEIKEELSITHRLARQFRSQISADSSAILDVLSYGQLEELVRQNMGENLDLLGLNFTGKPRTKLFPPPGFMRRMGILGIYFPFTGESYIDPTLHVLEQPFTIAHEMAHSYGITNEGEANFIAWVICTNSTDPLLKYSGHLRLLLYQIRDFSTMAPEEFKEWLKALDPGIRNDIVSIQELNAKYPPISLELSRKANDVFLKSQGVAAGIKSYQQLPMLAFAWRKRMN
ncbi:DUF3810 domain-containing protein [Algoriphagus sp. CAU 1675]|uniref:DUF3810 domain-containing protein n=1 Tax=Algoriphagus sp. CAU 1675 TaxID=3032597 RepID=UPI0023DA4FF7|nr:DUF3810 domain-containing protein [Algoriphagus sp. CAU 1675]MDF2156856.1 DUF3810 domain-containing protein [Algoriphagus sp. CAU 1675]